MFRSPSASHRLGCLLAVICACASVASGGVASPASAAASPPSSTTSSVLQQSQSRSSQSQSQSTTFKATPHTSANDAAAATTSSSQHSHDIEIKALSGEPAYKSVNLTWTVDDVVDAGGDGDDATQPTAFTVYYCEMQSWGAHRCKSQAVTTQSNEVDDGDGDGDDPHGDSGEAERHMRHQYEATIGKLRMATKYLFHVKPTTAADGKRGRADLGLNELGPNGIFLGQSIVIPTKGFQAYATKCLPHASEIEVETGPHFGGRIVADGGLHAECGVAGDERSSRDRYVLRIDHRRCGSHVDHAAATVQTFITVQENRGIFTHSTRRFMVVCSYQPDTLTVRASFSVPGKGNVQAAAEPAAAESESEWSSERAGRQRKFRMVGKEALVLREAAAAAESGAEESVEPQPQRSSGRRTARRRVDAPSAAEVAKNLVDGGAERQALKMSKYARLVHEESRSYEDSQANYTGLVIVASLSVILVGSIVYIAHRESAKRRRANQSS